jgi:hypothetical protein
MSDLNVNASSSDALDAWDQAQASNTHKPSPAAPASTPAGPPPQSVLDFADKAWQPNLLHQEGDPGAARSAVRDGQGGTVEINSSGRKSGWGSSFGSQGNFFGGWDIGKRKPVADPGINPAEIFVYRNEGLGKNAAQDLAKILNVDPESAGFKQVFGDNNDKGLIQPYKRTGRESFLSQQFVHAGGFYPGDPSTEGQNLQKAQAEHPKNTADLEERRWGGNVSTNAGGYVQFYGSANIVKKSGLGAARYIPERNDTVSYAYKARVVEGNEEQINQVGSAYAFNQAQVRLKANNKGEMGADIGSYSEAGGSYSSTFFPGEKAASDWWLSHGELKNNLDDPEQKTRGQEFADLAALGYQLKGESLLPALGDNNAQVFLRVPDANVNFGNRSPSQGQDVLAIPPDAGQDEYFTAPDGTTLQHPLAGSNEYRTHTDRKADENLLDWAKRKLPFTEKDQYISVDNLSALMTQAASRAPQHMELAYVTPEALADANKDKLYTIVDPTTGETTQGFKVGEWVNTGLMQVEGERGLFVDRDRLPDSLFKPDGSLNPEAQLDHWKDHLSPVGQESLTTPHDLQQVTQKAAVHERRITPTLGGSAEAFLRDTRATAEAVRRATGEMENGLSRAPWGDVKPGEPFTTVPRPQYYSNASQYVEDMETYLAVSREVYRAADEAGIALPQQQGAQPVSAAQRRDAVQAQQDWLQAHRETITAQIDQAQRLSRQTQDEQSEQGGQTQLPPQTPSFDAFPIK